MSADQTRKAEDVNGGKGDGDNAVFLATKGGASWEELEALVEGGAVFQTTNTKGNSILHVAAEAGNLEALKYFISKGMEVDARNLEGFTPLIKAGSAQKNLLAIVDLLVENGADLHAVEPTGFNVFFVATFCRRSLEDLRGLMSRGVNWKTPNTLGLSILHMASAEGTLEALQFFISLGADVSARNDSKVTPLLHTIFTKRDFLAKVDLLLEHGAELNAVDESGNNLIIWATIKGRPTEDLEGLISRGADWRKPNSEGYTMLQVAMFKYDLELVGFYISKGADVNARDSRGRTPFINAISVDKNSMEMAELLAKNGADVEAVDDNGRTAIMYAAFQGKSRKEMQQLVAWGAKWETKDGFGRSILHLAAEGGNFQILRYLIANGADVNARNSVGETPLLAAVRRAEKNLVKTLAILKNRGADVSAVDLLGNDAVLLAIEADRTKEEVRKLIRIGCTWMGRNKEGQTAFQLISNKVNRELLDLFSELLSH